MFVTIAPVHSSALWCWESDSNGHGGGDSHCPALGNQAETSTLEVWSPCASTVIRAWLKPQKSEQEINLGDTITPGKSLWRRVQGSQADWFE